LPFWICRQRAGSCGNTWAELAPTRSREGSYGYAGRTQPGGPAETAGRSIKRMVQPRDVFLGGCSWESPGEGQIRMIRNTRRSSYDWEKASACREVKGESTYREPGVWPMACGER
jgi:hypothetical protein